MSHQKPKKNPAAIINLLADALDVSVGFKTFLPSKFFGVLGPLEIPGKKLQPH